MANIINGGKHADNKIDFQEFMVMPSAPRASPKASAWSPRSSTPSRACSRRPATTPPSATRAASPRTSTNEEAIKFILDAIDKAGYNAGRDKDIAIALDSACSELFDEGGKKGYKFWKSRPRQAASPPTR